MFNKVKNTTTDNDTNGNENHPSTSNSNEQNAGNEKGVESE